jgi:WD40 repeat protein
MTLAAYRTLFGLLALLLVGSICVPLTAPIRAREIPQGKEEARVQVKLAFRLRGHRHSVNQIAFDRKGSRCYTAGSDATIKLWDLAARREIWTIEEPENVECLALTPDGALLATAIISYKHLIPPGQIKLWDAQTGKHVRTLTGHTDDVLALAVSPDGKRLVSGASNSDGSIQVWETASGKCLARKSLEEGKFVRTLVYSPDGKTFASGGSEAIVRVWDAESCRFLHNLTQQPVDPDNDYVGVRGLAYSPDGKSLASATYRSATIWDVRSGKMIRRITAFTKYVNRLAFSPDGKYLATGGDEKTLKLWEVATGREVAVLPYDFVYVYALQFSPDGRYLVTDDFHWDKNRPTGDVLVWEVKYPKSAVPR